MNSFADNEGSVLILCSTQSKTNELATSLLPSFVDRAGIKLSFIFIVLSRCHTLKNGVRFQTQQCVVSPEYYAQQINGLI